MLELLAVIWVVNVFAKMANKKGYNKYAWGALGAISYYGGVLLMGFVIFPELVYAGIIPVHSETQLVAVAVILNLLFGVMCCLISYFILKKQPNKAEQDSINRVENYLKGDNDSNNAV